jgi:hypothetical protein
MPSGQLTGPDRVARSTITSAPAWAAQKVPRRPEVSGRRGLIRGRACNGTVSYVEAVSARSGRVPAGVVSVHSGSGAARV